MGMHHGPFAAMTTPERFVEALSAYAGVFELGPPVADFDDLGLGSDDDGWTLAIGERDGRTYVIDTSLLLSHEADLVVALSRDLGGTVVGAGAETASGTYWFAAATDGESRRVHWNGYDSVTEPFDDGDPLPTEADAPLEDLDGDGLRAAIDDLGFDILPWEEGGPWRRLRYSGETFPSVEGPFGPRLEAHMRDHAIPEGKRPKPKVVRRDGGYDIAHANSQQPGGEATSGGRGCLGGAMLAMLVLALGLVALGAAVLAG